MTESTAYDELMPKIQALIAPGDLSSKDKSSSEHHFFKRKGKWHNHDYCDACGEKGKLLCCDICPASFHLLCHDPPLDVAHVPNGPWTCSACNNIRDRKNYPSRNPYKIEFVNGSSTSTGLIRGRRIQNSSRNVQKKDLLPTKSLLFLSLCKSNSSSLANANTSKSVGSKPTNYDFISPATGEKGLELRENLSKLNPRYRPIQADIRPNNGNASPNTPIDHQDVDTNNSDVEIKDEWIEETEYIPEDTNSNRNLQRKNILSADETVEKSCHDGVDASGNTNRSNFNISILNCDFVLGKKPIPGERTEAHISSLEKCCLVKERNTDRNNVNGIEKIFNVVVSETKKLNPRQFTLPREYVADLEMNILKPEKDSDSFSCDWDSNDLLKIPAKRCYFCNGICLSGQLISCDYCPAHFHLNCLDPPMCSVPDVKWMCPLHPHHILERVMDNPDSITQLTAWWRDFSESVDSKEVISKFMKKINRRKKNAPPLVEGSVKIPDIVKYHYKNPVRHIPERNDSTSRKTDCVFEENFTLIPHELIMISNDCCSRQRLQGEKWKSQITSTETVEKEKTAFANAACRNESRYNPQSLIEITSDDQKDFGDSKPDENVSKKDDNLSTWDPKSKSFRFKSYGIYDVEVPAGLAKEVTPQYDKPPWEKIEEILDESVERDLIIGGSKYTALDRKLKSPLINEEIQLIVQDLPPSFLPGCEPYPFTPPFMKNSLIPNKKSSSKIHAVLCPLSHRAPIIFMNEGTLSIGTDFSNDVCLLNYGHCNFVSSEHAVIFYDKPSNTYELLNYSEYCTVVDGIAYTCDISSPTESDKISSEIPTVDKVVDKKSCTKQSNDVPAEKVIEPTEKLKPDPTTGAPSISRTKPSGLESRNLFKKLMTDIDKLILKSKKEMASIAEEDLNEIARAVKASTDANKAFKESGVDKLKAKKRPDLTVHLKRFDTEIIDICDEDSQPKTVSKENTISANSKSSPIIISDDSCEQFPNQNTFVPDTITASSALPVIEEVKSLVNQAEATTLRRSERKIKRSFFATYRRELRKDKKLELDMLGIDSEDESKVAKKKTSPPVVTVEDEPTNNNSNRPLNNGRYVPDTKEKCRCQMNNIDLPDGMDASWESAAVLHHGSHIRFGCVEFVLSIVNYKTDLKVRSYQQLRTSSSRTSSSRARKPKGKGGRPPEGAPPPKKAKKVDHEDLSSKLRSLLNNLSKSSPSGSSNSSAANLSPRSSPELSRSPSPGLPSDFSSLIEVNYEETDHVRHEIRTEES